MMLVVIGGLIVIALISRGPVSTVIRGQSTPADNRPLDMGPHLSLLASIIRSGERPSDWLVSLAVEEAWTRGDYQMADKLANAFESVDSLPPAPLASEPATPVTEETPPIAFKKQSPLDGVKDDEWNDFVVAMARDLPTFETERHVGIFHHHKKRLTQLGIDPSTILANPDSQYDAFERDILDCHGRYGSLLDAKVTEMIDIDGTEHVATKSGLLALLKTGGPKGAEKWLSSPTDRKSFPQTTEAFVRSNGIF